MSARDAFRDNDQIEVITDVPGWLVLTVSPSLESKAQVVNYLRSDFANLPEGLCDALILAIDELLSNAMEHGCKLDPTQCVRVAVIHTARLVLIGISDYGSGFSLGEIEHAALNNPPGDPLYHAGLRSQMGLRPGGFGIMLAKEAVDELIYNEFGNKVTMIKYL